MPRTKKTKLTPDQADELEQLITDYLTPEGFGNPWRDISDLLRQVGCPKDVTAGIKARCESIADDARILEEEISRGNAEVVAEGCKSLDEYLGKRFNVSLIRNRKYHWMVWS